MNNVAPILLFTYKRLETLKNTVQALKSNKLADESELFIFSDGAKDHKDEEVIAEIRTFIKTISGFKKVSIIESKHNKGLATSIIDGVNSIFKEFHKVIVLEDDLITTPNFLSFMNECLNQYNNDLTAFSVSGYSFNLGEVNHDTYDSYFLNRGWSWGWATWKNRWDKVDWTVGDFEDFKKNRSARKKFSMGGSDLNKMLDMQMTGQLDSWAIRWFYHQFKVGGLTVYPVYSKVFNDGFDQHATHTNGSIKRYLPRLDKEVKNNFILPTEAKISHYYQHQFIKKMGIRSRIISKLETIFQKIFA